MTGRGLSFLYCGELVFGPGSDLPEESLRAREDSQIILEDSLRAREDSLKVRELVVRFGDGQSCLGMA